MITVPRAKACKQEQRVQKPKNNRRAEPDQPLYKGRDMRNTMPTTGLNKVLKHLCRSILPPDRADFSDGQLLNRFLANRDEVAFAALVQRHAPLVLGVCNRVIGNIHDSEDAFQAVFFILARKARTVCKSEALASWLYKVAYRTALEAKETIVRRRKLELPMLDVPEPEFRPMEERRDWQVMLDQELDQLPAKYRSLVIMCDLQGRTRKEVARQLGLKEGTLSSRLATARRMLATRLSKYGLTVSGGALAVALAQSSASAKVPASLVWSTAKAATFVAAGQVVGASAPAITLMKGAMKTMFLAKLKTVIGTSIVAVAFGLGGLLYNAELSSGGAQAADEAKPKSELEKLRKENELLKMNLQVTLEKIIAQEDELKKLRGPTAKMKERLGGDVGVGLIDVDVNGRTDVGVGQIIKRPDGRAKEDLPKNPQSNQRHDLSAPERHKLAETLPDKAKTDVVGQLEMAIKALQAVENKEVRTNAIEALLQEIERVKSGEKKTKDATADPQPRRY
jgi:RNA polymerase sigma factor (sigma-70 family)